MVYGVIFQGQGLIAHKGIDRCLFDNWLYTKVMI